MLKCLSLEINKQKETVETVAGLVLKRKHESALIAKPILNILHIKDLK